MRLAAALALFLLAASSGFAQPDFRLPNSTKPVAYRLELAIRPESPDFTGNVEIDLDLVSRESSILLNSKGLSISETWVENSGRRLAAKSTTSGDEFLGVTPAEPVGPGRVRLGIRFAGRLSEKSPVGAFRRQENGRWYVFTAFTAIDARRAFPCFDQPEFKAPWSISLRVPAADTAVANSRITSETPDGEGWKRVEFAKTKPMASEVVAFGVGPFDIVDDGVAGANRIPVRIIAPQGRGAQAAGAKGASRELLARLEAYTGIPYMWDKLDHLALLDMPFGAIENPGLITYRDQLLLARPERDTPEHRQALRGTMAHELAHQWFGNLVTQRWWDDVWLSEGFASWLGVKTSDLDLPEAERGLAAVESHTRIMNVDRRPVRLDMHSRAEMDQVYSGIVYQKGAGVLSMVEHWLGEEPFRRGLQRYLRDHSYQSATTADLAAALTEETKVAVGPVLDSFLNQPGFPTLKATFDCASRRVALAQESNRTWTVPVCTRAGCTVVKGPISSLPAENCPAWLNAQGTGYYRVEVDDWSAMLKSQWNSMTAAERLDAVSDIAQLPPATQVVLLPMLARDRNPRVLAAVQRLALKLALAPNADLEAIRKIQW